MFGGFVITLAFAAALTCRGEELHGVDTWAGIKPRPAVVNPVGREASPDLISLRGEWEFVTQPKAFPRRYRHTKVPFAKVDEQTPAWLCASADTPWSKARKINVPGAWEAQGVGEPGMSVTWDPLWDSSPKRIRHVYMGEGWYRKDVVLPRSWAGKKVWLKIGGVKSQGWFWVNKHPVAWVDNYCGTYKYDITPFVKLGETNRVLVCVNNALPSRKGLMSNVHRWGGIYRDVEIEATPQTFIDDAWVRGDFDAKCAEAHVAVGRAYPPDEVRPRSGCPSRGACPQAAECTRRVEDNAPYQIHFTVDGNVVSAAVAPDGETIVRLPLPDFRPWSPEHPNLYTGVVELVENGVVIETRRERFGVRKFEVRGKDFYLNDKPFFMRGCGFHEVDPIYGRHRPRREDCRARIAKARAAGFNFARLHTRCESPEFFEAADELGLMLQPELPYYGDFSTGMAPFEPLADVRELWENFRRHPSFAVYSGGNEGTFGPVLGPKFYATVKAMDPDRLVFEQDTMVQPPWKRSPSDAKNAQVWRGAGVTDKKDLAHYRIGKTDDFIAFPDRIWPRGKYDRGRR